jgi:hypothetical protein
MVMQERNGQPARSARGGRAVCGCVEPLRRPLPAPPAGGEPAREATGAEEHTMSDHGISSLLLH